MKKFFLAMAMLSVVIALAVPIFANAITPGPPATAQGGSNAGFSGGDCKNLTTEGLRGVVGCVIGLFNYAILIMIAAAIVYVVYGAFLMISSEEKREAGKQTIYYGIIGIFVMVSVWGFVNILDSTFNLSKTGPFDPPKLINK